MTIWDIATIFKIGNKFKRNSSEFSKVQLKKVNKRSRFEHLILSLTKVRRKKFTLSDVS